MKIVVFSQRLAFGGGKSRFYDDPAVHFDAPGAYYDGFLPPIPKKGKIQDIALNLSKMSIEELYTYATALHTGMVAQAATFTTPNPTPAAFLTGLTDAQGGNSAYEAAKVTLTGPSSPVGPLGQVLNLVVTAGDNEGSLDVGWDPTKGAISFELQTSSEPVTRSSWVHKAVSVKSSTTLAGFTSGTKVWVRVGAIGANNQKGPWSDPAVKTVP